MRLFMTISLILLCLVDKSYGGFKDFLTNLPSEVAKAFSTAWTSITDAIHRPHRIVRLGKRGRLKTLPTQATERTEPPPTTQPFKFLRISTEGPRVTIPLITSPSFRTFGDWRRMQNAHYVVNKKNRFDDRDPDIIFLQTPKPETDRYYINDYQTEETFVPLLYI
ncbi:uncharacterized protein LOC110376514 isoform X4 [Helicoverpa armigera]|uniref:uncharacterized protein LOC110376514 isoform X4 n=1 Tax=Helicoverpa armigera TaxID=29058 RepID=UPI0021123E92|nr:uncharacterized protein LOC110376514 isoform X3 [Helicoverpa armigera]